MAWLHGPWLPTIAICATAVAMVVAPPAPAAAHSPSTGYDISYPQCGVPLPRDPAFGIVGVNGGRAFTENPCLEQQLRWVRQAANGRPAFYANTGNPGPAVSTRWPIGQDSPRPCRASAPNSEDCSLDYGWNAAKDSFDNAVAAIRALDGVGEAEAERRAAAGKWWLDVEILNSWQTLDTEHYGPTARSRWNDIYALAGAVRALWDEGVGYVGIYSTPYQWEQITGGRAYTSDWFSANPVWLAGYEGEADARAGCDDDSFTGGPVALTQYLSDEGFDANVDCD